MYISKLDVRNYKSFYGASELDFRPGFNVITGQNSSGKTALLEALSLNFPCVPHRSLRTIPNEGGTPPQISEIDVSVAISASELMEFLFAGANEFVDINLPSLDFSSEFAISQRIGNERGLIDWFLNLSSFVFSIRLTKLPNTEKWSIPSFPSYGRYGPVPSPEGNVHFVHFRLNRDREISNLRTFHTAGGHEV